jgi:uncharacterized protein YdhG (YjbR/CyaY superfamily)
MREKFTSVDEYIKTFPKDVQEILTNIRKTIQKTIPEAKETISYNIPCYKYHDKYVVYFSGYKNHVSIYPRPHDGTMVKELAPYASGRGTLQFQLKDPVPYDLIVKVTKVLLKENLERTGY